MSVSRVVSVRFPVSVLARIEAVSGHRGRNRFICDAVVAALGSVGDLSSDASALLSVVRRERLTSREAEKVVDWLGLRFRNAERELLDAGLVRFVDGLMVAE